MRSVVVRAALLLALGACGFHGPALALDATVAGDDDAPPGASSPAFCDPADPHLVVCYELDGNTRDASSHHLDATMANVSFVPGKVGMAMSFGATSAADVPDSPAFDVAALTIEAWIQPAVLPIAGARAGILDMDGQYGVFLHSGGDLTCTLVGAQALPPSTAKVVTGKWTHVACTYDGAKAALYVNGVAVASATGGGPLGKNGSTGISLAADNPPTVTPRSQLVGLIDQVRMMNVARTPAELCADAGQPSCP